MSRLLRSLGPAVDHVAPLEALRAGFGALIGLLVVGLFVLSPQVDLELGLYLVAPFGASSVLLFAVPSSPLAQPWSAMVGNTVAALVGVAVSLLIEDPALRVAVAVGLAISLSMLARALHPPAGAVAMTAALSPEAVESLGFWFALTPVATGTALLIALAAAYARLTGRRYPFRQFDEPSAHDTADRNPIERLGLSEAELSELLDRYRQSFNLGVEDLARLIGAAELQAAAHMAGPLTALGIMSKSLVTVAPDTRLAKVADLFLHHRFISLPVVSKEGQFHGLILQTDLIAKARSEALALHSGYIAALRRLLTPRQRARLTAGDLLHEDAPSVSPDTGTGALLSLFAAEDADALPVLDEGRLVGIVTHSDLIAAMARITARRGVS